MESSFEKSILTNLTTASIRVVHIFFLCQSISRLDGLSISPTVTIPENSLFLSFFIELCSIQVIVSYVSMKYCCTAPDQLSAVFALFWACLQRLLLHLDQDICYNANKISNFPNFQIKIPNSRLLTVLHLVPRLKLSPAGSEKRRKFRLEWTMESSL